MSTIPANDIVNVIPSVQGVGGAAININGMALTTGTRVPIGTVQSFATPALVSAYFGASAAETKAANVYFGGYAGATTSPAAMNFTQYPLTAVAAYIRGGSLAAMTLAQLQALNGSLTAVIDGYSHVISSINLSTATSFSNAAASIQAAFTDPTEASFTASLGASITSSLGAHAGTCTSTGTTLTLGSLTNGYLSAGDLVSGTDSTNSLPAGCYIVAQLTGTPGGSAGATFQLSAAATPGNLTSCTVTGTSTVLDATVVTGFISVGDTVTTISANAVVASQLTGTTGAAGTYQLSGITAQGIASGSMVVKSTVLDVTVDTDHTIAVGQTLVSSGVTGTPLITAQISGTPGGVGFYRISGAQQQVASESMTAIATAPLVTFDSVSSAFVITSGVTGAASLADYCTGTLSASLNLTAVTGAVLSQGAAAAIPATFMNALIQITQNWATFFTLFDPDGGSGNTQKLAFSAWTNTQKNRYAYICSDTDVNPTTTVPATNSLGYLLQQNGYSGTYPKYQPSDLYGAAFISGVAASINFAQTNGRTTFAFRQQAGLVAGVTSELVSQNLLANGYNYYGVYSGGNSSWIMEYNGSVSGPFLWFDSYINQIQMNVSFQQALMNLLTQVGSIPYNTAGDALIEQALAPAIDAAGNFGTFRAGITLSASQIIAVNNAAGANIASVLQTRGWYLQVQAENTAPNVRAARGTPPMTFWYVDGESVQKMSLNSIVLQ